MDKNGEGRGRIEFKKKIDFIFSTSAEINENNRRRGSLVEIIFVLTGGWRNTFVIRYQNRIKIQNSNFYKHRMYHMLSANF